MRRRQFVVMAILVFAGAMLGGALCNWLLLGTAAHADENMVPPFAKTAVARAFVVVNEKGIPRAALALDANDRPSLRLLDRKGHKRVRLVVENYGRPAIEIMDKEEKIVWTAP